MNYRFQCFLRRNTNFRMRVFIRRPKTRSFCWTRWSSNIKWVWVCVCFFKVFLIFVFVQRLVDASSPLITLEIGSGSGVVSAFLRRMLPGSFAYCTDVNAHALRCTRRTAELNRLDTTTQLELLQCDLMGPLVRRLKHSVDILLFNPPYVPSEAPATNLNVVFCLLLFLYRESVTVGTATWWNSRDEILGFLLRRRRERPRNNWSDHAARRRHSNSKRRVLFGGGSRKSNPGIVVEERGQTMRNDYSRKAVRNRIFVCVAV